MGSENYYPEYYLRKRKRDQTYALFTRVAFAVIVLGGFGALAGYLLFQYVLLPRKASPGVTEEMARERQNLGIEARLAQAPVVKDREVPQYQAIDLQALPYTDSFAASSVSLAGLGSAAGASSAQPSSKEAKIVAEPPVTGETPSMASPAESQQAPPAVATEKPKPAAEGKPSSANDKPKEQSKPKPAAAEVNESKPKTNEKPRTNEGDSSSKSSDSSKDKIVYKVYAGSGKNREQADQLKRELAGLGYSASLIESGSDVLVLVAVLDDYNKASALAQDLNRQGFGSTFTTKAKR